MNAYYHEFSISFNWWMVFAIGMLVFSILVGIFQTKVVRKTVAKKDGIKTRYYHKYHYIERFNDNIFIILGVLSGIIFMVMLFVESADGIIQFFDNSLGKFDSPVWSLIETGVSVPIVSTIFGIIITFVGAFANIAKVLIVKFYYRHLRRPFKRAARATRALVDEFSGWLSEKAELVGHN